MPKLTFTELELVAIEGALRLAAEKYDANAEELSALPNHDRLAQAFRDQATVARQIRDKVEEATYS